MSATRETPEKNTDRTLPPDPPTTVLARRYRVVRQLGQGGMGSVWLAEDMQLDNRPVAIKMLPSILVSNKRAYNQLKAEALVSMQLSHPNIATVRAFEENEGNPFLVIDYIDGLTLDEYLGRKGKLTEEVTASILLPVAEALDYAHAKGIVHRDVKPGNVMVTWDGTPYVLDFGIAREIQETLTRVTGKFSSGTLLYMSPEQLRGQSPKAAQDVYSFAVLAYECLTGMPPFSRGQVEYQILNEPPASLPEGIAMGWRVMKGLAKDPAERPKSCCEILSDWSASFGRPPPPEPKPEPKPAPPPPTQPPPTQPKPSRPKPVVVPQKAGEAKGEPPRARMRKVVAAAAFALLGLLLLVVGRSRDDFRPEAQAPAVAAQDAAGKPAGLDAAYIDVGVIVGRVERLERREDSAAKIDRVLDTYRRGQRHFDLSQWDDAARLFAEVKASAEELFAADEARKRALIPTLRLEALVDGRAVKGAKIKIGDREYESPVDLGEVAAHKMQGPFSVTYRENYRLYEGEFQGRVVDWTGSKTLTFALDEHKFPAPGTRKELSLPAGGSLAVRWCPAGEFVMGAENVLGADHRTRPHRVGFEKGFWMGETEVSQGQWRKLMETTVLEQVRKALESDVNFPYNVSTGEKRPPRGCWCVPKATDPLKRVGDIDDAIPVYYVNWSEAREFCRRLTLHLRANGGLPEGYECRLPTEAEWEYACRAGVGGELLPNYLTPEAKAPGNVPELEKIAWYVGTSSWNFRGRGWELENTGERHHEGRLSAPRAVGLTEANDWGLHDMLGNVREWCSDCWNLSLGSAADELSLSPRIVSQSKTRVMRGGCWADAGHFCMPWSRSAFHPLWRANNIGFRVALAPAYEGYPYEGDLAELAADTADPDREWKKEEPVEPPKPKTEEKAEEIVVEIPHDDPKPKEEAKPTLLLTTTLHGTSVTAKIVEGVVESGATTPTTITINTPLGEDWSYTLEYDDNGSCYRTEGTWRAQSGRNTLTVALEDGAIRPAGMSFCRHCGTKLTHYVTIGRTCPSCRGNLHGE